MEENKLYKSLIICVVLFISLLLGTILPKFNVDGFELKNIDLFADLRVKNRTDLPSNTLNSNRQRVFDLTYLPYIKSYTHYLAASDGISRLKELPNFSINSAVRNNQLIYRLKTERSRNYKPINELVAGSSLLEDYSPEGTTFDRFFKVLNTLKQGTGKGRIAMFGDSFIEGDIFCADVRNSLQDVFGGNGVGFVPITSEVAQFRFTIGHEYTGFQSYSVVKKVDQYEPYGAGGFCFTAGNNNNVTYSVNTNYKHLNLFRDARLFYNSPENTSIKYSLNKTGGNVVNISASNRLQQSVLKNINATTISFNFPVSDTLKLYGVSFEDSTGIYVDNFGLRGNSGLGLNQISEKMNREFNQLQDYQLIILQYGLNVVAPDSKDLNWYINPMINVVQRLKRSFPDAAILLMGVSDRSAKIDGDDRTMESIPIMIAAQREIARRSQVAFFNLFEAMGGENSMVSYVESDPPLANKDYTHLTFQGGRKVAGIFVKTLLNEFQKYNDQVKNRAPADSLSFIGSNQ